MKTSLTRIVLAAIVAGIAWFLWGAFAHIVLQFGESSIKQLPNEAAVAAALREGNPEDGLYAFPYWGGAHGSGADEAQIKELEAKFAQGPVGILIYQRSVKEMMPPSTLLLELLGGTVACFFAGLVISKLSVPPSHAAFAGGMCAVAAWFSHSYSEWLWYAYPLSWVTDALLEQVIGWVIAAWIIALIVGAGRKGAAS
ncbi:MAG: hypothetical protein EXS03_02115 [Phycisphaerales bacterium]|nr:hypothetical protein [Phycisphaerales bacterium]